MSSKKLIKILDSTLREGEQTPNVSFNLKEKLFILEMLVNDINIDRVEITSALISDNEFNIAKEICKLSSRKKVLNKIEILGFIGQKESIEWIFETGCKIVNLLCKSSSILSKNQLNKSFNQQLQDIKNSVIYARKLNLQVNIYLEDWSRAMLLEKNKVYKLIDELSKIKIERIILCDTLGLLEPFETFSFCNEIINKYKNILFDLHSHNDYDLSVANSYAGIKAGIDTIHATINGIGERAGITSLSSIVALINDKSGYKTNINEKKLLFASKIIEKITNKKISFNAPIIGKDVFTHTCGVHVNGDIKGKLYSYKLIPNRFNRKYKYSLGKTSGKSNINILFNKIKKKNINNEVIVKTLEYIKFISDKKYNLNKNDIIKILNLLKKNKI